MTTTAAPLWYGVSLELPAIQLAEDASEVPAVSTIQLSREGRWMHPVYGLLEFDAARYQRFINNFDANVRKTQLALDIEHLPLEGAAAWFVPYQMRMQATDKGLGLFVDVRWTPNGLQRVKDEEYKYVSLTFKPQWLDPETGEKYQDVVFGAALTTDPFIKGMAPVQDGLVMLSEFVELSEAGSRDNHEINEGGKGMPQSAEAMRTDNFVDKKAEKELCGQQKLSGERSEPTLQECPDCKGSGKTDGGDECPVCKGEGKIPVPGEANLSEDSKKVKADLEKTQVKEKKADEAIEKAEDSAIAQLDDDGSVEEMAEQFHQQGKALCEKLSGKTGAPMVRQHMAATHKLLSPILEKMQAKGEPAKMSETTQAQNPDFIKLAERLAAVEAKSQQDTIELARLREEKQRNDVVKLTEKWFPRQGEEGFRCKSGDRNKVVDLLMELSAIDGRENERLIQLSEGAAVPEDKQSKLVARVVALVESIPEPRLLNLSSKAVSDLDPEADIKDESSRMAAETRRLSETEKIPFAHAARKLNDARKRR